VLRRSAGGLLCVVDDLPGRATTLRRTVCHDAVVEVRVQGGVAHIPVGAPIYMDWARGLHDATAALAARDDVRVVLLAGEGRFFSPGGDLVWMNAQRDRVAALFELATTLHAGLEGLAALPAPVVARVHAAAAGAGFALVLAADIAVAGASASFTMAYTGVGLSPDGGSTWMLPRIVGRRRATELMLLNPRIDAQQAQQLGIVTRTVGDAELDETVDEIVRRLASGPTAAYGAVKRLLADSSQSSYSEQLAAEADAISWLAGSPTGAEGIAAFLEKRSPDFDAAARG
jgi:2-(1,2-epoxy-1,2-dihydrophenyl)acetyl-CoA isomerase